jgi:hypothetical protein
VSCTDLFWRLREAFGARGGGFYLKGQVHLTRYEHYKALSTLYRMASLLGWIRALRRELLFLPRTDPEGAEKLEAALRRFTSALAEGGTSRRGGWSRSCTFGGSERMPQLMPSHERASRSAGSSRVSP